MKIVFFTSDKQRERVLAQSFALGARRHGATVHIKRLDEAASIDWGIDLACMVGVKSGKLWRRAKAEGVPTMMFDKGYTRQKAGGSWLYWRVAYDHHQPTPHTLNRVYSQDRFNRLDLQVLPWREVTDTGHVLIAGSSEKYSHFYGMEGPTEYARGLIAELKKHTDRRIIYRPKPSWRGAEAIDGATFSKGVPLLQDFTDCHAVVTHGSNTCYEAALYGIPSVVLGDGVMVGVSSTSLADIERPQLGDRQPVFNALAYHQWTLKEMSRGHAFDSMRHWF